MKTIADVTALEANKDFVAPVRILDAQGKVLRVVSAEEFRRTHPGLTADRDFSTARHRPRRAKMKGLVAGAAALVLAMIASPAMAYMAVVTTSLPVAKAADEPDVRTAAAAAVTDVLTRGIAFSPTIVTPEKASRTTM